MLSEKEQDKLIHDYAFLVRLIINIHYKNTSKDHIDELMSCGNVALVRAARTFIPGKAAFRTFAWNSIRWAMQDYFRAQTNMPRHQWAEYKETGVHPAELPKKNRTKPNAKKRGRPPMPITSVRGKRERKLPRSSPYWQPVIDHIDTEAFLKGLRMPMERCDLSKFNESKTKGE